MRGALRAIGGLVVVVAAGLVLPGNAGALPQADVEIGPGESIEIRYPIVAGNNPLGQAHTPEACRTSVYCDVIRLKMRPPEDPAQGYFVRIQMGWANFVEQDVPGVGEVTENDMDMYVYRVPYDTTATPEENEVTSGATTAQPETAYVSGSAVDVVVVNYLGVNREGYSLKFTYVLETDFKPFELMEEDPPPPADFAEAVEAEVAPAPAPEAPVALASSPALTSVGVDDPFGLSTAPSGKKPEVSLLREVSPTAARKPDPVSASVALLWLAVVPGALLGGVTVFLLRRRKSAFGL